MRAAEDIFICRWRHRQRPLSTALANLETLLAVGWPMEEIELLRCSTKIQQVRPIA